MTHPSFSSFSEFEKLVCESLQAAGAEVLPVSKNGVDFQYATRNPESGTVESVVVLIEDGNELSVEQLQSFSEQASRFGVDRVQIFTPTSFSSQIAMEALGLCISLNDGNSVSAASASKTPPPLPRNPPPPLPRVLSPAAAVEPTSKPGKSAFGLIGTVIAGAAAVFLLLFTAKFALKVASGQLSSSESEAEVRGRHQTTQAELPEFPLGVSPAPSAVAETPKAILREHFSRIYGVEQIPDGALKRLASALVLRSTGELPYLDLTLHRDSVAEVWKSPSRYPGLATALIRDLGEADLQLRTVEALLPILETHGDPFLLLKAKATRAELSKDADHLEVAIEAVGSLLEKTYGLQQHDPSVQIVALYAGPMDYVSDEGGKDFLELLSANTAIPEWLIRYADGRYHIDAAWKARGSGWAYSVTQEGWEGFYRELQLAGTALHKSWEANPEYPYAPASMIKVCMGASLPDKETRTWFLRAIEAQEDYLPAYRNYLWSILPRWGGSDAQLASFGIACVNSNRYDTCIPAILLESHHRRAMEWESEWEYWQARSDEEIRDLRNMFAAYADTAENPDLRNYYRSVEVAFVFTSVDRDEARDLLSALGTECNKPAVETFPFQYETIVSTLGLPLADANSLPPDVEE